MNVSLITMEPEQAQAKLEAYRAQLRKRADDEYEAAEAGYKALAEGKSLINLAEAIQGGGLGADGRPKLAVARADADEVRLFLGDNEVTFRTGAANRGRPARANAHRIAVQGASWRTRAGYALVPMVPADVRPARVNLSKCVILWEVVQWAERSNFARPDRDPYLLRQIAGDLYAVLASWDLTELERAIMGARVRT